MKVDIVISIAIINLFPNACFYLLLLIFLYQVAPSRILLELGWSYLGYTSFLNKQVLEWMKCQPFIRKDRIVVSGFSLGTEPLMVLGVMDPSIYAFIYNDFLCQTQERAIVMTEPDQRGRRPFPNSIRHLIPDFWKYFNFPDIVASLAPRPIILTDRFAAAGYPQRH